ncbi:probable ATP-dependent RNA helicase DDX5 [Caerostris extrusa]|uniref:RNA helicase n=1 Tax=Caerostris extrusa TaxID=172846 RepID=A0AAV4USV1_CAEEX|nr:probable ATP-dependent RNA helicase DDX5 [Caerostris extrusa]
MLRHVFTRFWSSSVEIYRLPQNLSKVISYDVTNFWNHSKGIYYDDEDTFNDSSYQTSPKYRQNRNFNKFQRRNRFDDETFSQNRARKFDSFNRQLEKPSFDLTEDILKYFYIEHSDVANRSIEDVESFRERLSISVTGTDVPKPISSFNELCLPDRLHEIVLQQGYSEPTPIQAQGWPIALSGRDMVGISQTGSGKTLVFLLPAIIHALNQPEVAKVKYESNPQVLILAPTRELVKQILEVSHRFSVSCNLKSACAYGGASKSNQLRELKDSNICIATPGRLIDFVAEGTVNLQHCTYLVLDEADRMLDMGFEPQIRKIISQIRPDRQTLMWSATWPREIQDLAEDFLNNYVKVTVGSGELVANPNIKQNIHFTKENKKRESLTSLLESIMTVEGNKVLVFAQTKRKVDQLEAYLSNVFRYNVLAIHGDVSQSRREHVLFEFRRSKSCVLIATDVAARGLDISDITHVINYDFPMSIEDYVHRIGRTARGSSLGEAHTFFTTEDAGKAKDLISVLEQANQEVDPRLFSMHELQSRYKRKSSGSQQWKDLRNRRYRSY